MATQSTKWQLLGGVLATPLFFIVAFAQAFAHPGFDITRHYLSQLSSGDLGWIQMANFIVVGGLYVLCAAAIGRVLSTGRGATWGPRLIGAFGVGLIAAGVFVADPANGYPTGYPPVEPTWHSMVHGLAAIGSGLLLTAAIFVFTARFLAEKSLSWAIYSAVSGIIYFVLPWINADLSSLLLPVASVIGWGWVSVVAWRLSVQPRVALRNGQPAAQPA
jgi:hypothetical membrane protein